MWKCCAEPKRANSFEHTLTSHSTSETIGCFVWSAERSVRVWEISGRHVAMVSEMTHKATSFFIAGAKWVISFSAKINHKRSRACARKGGGGAGREWFHCMGCSVRICVWLSENVVSR